MPIVTPQQSFEVANMRSLVAYFRVVSGVGVFIMWHASVTSKATLIHRVVVHQRGLSKEVLL